MESKKKKMSKKSRRGLIIAVLILAALLIFYLTDPEGFYTFMNNDVAEWMGETPEPSGTSEPATTPAQTTPTAAPSAEPAATEPVSAPPAVYDGALEVYLIDVGQADSIFLRSPSGKTMLVDAAESGDYDAVNGFLKAQDVDRLDIVVATHPHSDHIGGMWKVIRDYDIGNFYLSPVAHTTATFEKMLSYLEDNDVPTAYAVRGDETTIAWDEDVTIDILSPIDGFEYDDLNDWSVILRVSYGETAILLTGDAEAHAESIALSQLPSELFAADVLKLGHHGSSSSSSPAFVNAVNPEIAVTSLGEGNDYGHPHRETLEWIAARGIPFYRTDLNGTVKIVLDGTECTVTTER